MRANELMIGDIVMFKHQHYPTRIKVIDNTHCMPFEDMRVPEWVKYGGLEDIEPIPLTPEILEKNGFIGDLQRCYMYHCCGNYFVDMYFGGASIEIYEEKGHYQSGFVCRTIKIEKCRYVHTLQHALRLCGLNDLADNFKIE